MITTIVWTLLAGIGIGLNIGLWLGTSLTKRWMRPVLDGYKKDSAEWFEAYMRARKESHENYMK